MSDRALIELAISKFAEAYNSGDLDTVFAYYELYAGDQIRFCRWDGATLQLVVVTLDDETTRDLARERRKRMTASERCNADPGKPLKMVSVAAGAEVGKN